MFVTVTHRLQRFMCQRRQDTDLLVEPTIAHSLLHGYNSYYLRRGSGLGNPIKVIL